MKRRMMEELIIAAVSPSYSAEYKQNKAADSELHGDSSRRTELLFSLKNIQKYAAGRDVRSILK